MRQKLIKIINIFDRSQQKKIIWLVFVMLLNGGLELIGVSAILPFINAITDVENLQSQWYAQILTNYLGLDYKQIVVVICIFIIGIYVLKNGFLLYLSDIQYKFIYYGNRNLNNEIMRYYIMQDYEFYLSHSSAELIKDISNDTPMFYATVLNVLQLLTEMIVCSFLLFFLLVTDPLITLGVALSLFLILLFFMSNYKEQLADLGNQRRYYSCELTKNMQQVFGGIKEIKISNKEQYFISVFEEDNAGQAEANRRNLFLNAIPRPLMEVICITGIMIVICIKVWIGKNMTAFVGILAVFAVAAFRLLPSVNKISSYIGGIAHNGVVIDTIYQKIKEVRASEIKILQLSKQEELSFEREILIHNVSFRYADASSDILDNVLLSIPKNKSIALIGPSGAGKTTLANIILGLLVPTRGSVEVDGTDIRNHLASWRKKIGYIPQNIYMLDDTIRNNVAFGVDEINDDEVWNALEEAQIKKFVQNLPDGLDTRIGESGVRISGGQRQRIGIARALYHKPELLILDEATSALDNETESAVMEAIEHFQGQLTMIIIAHRLTTIKNCDIVWEVKDRGVIRKEER